MKKATVRPRLSGDKLADAVPPAYRAAVVEATDPGGEYSLLLFAHAERDVVSSTEVKKALRRLAEPAPDGVVFVGTVFTFEARTLAAIQGAGIIAFRSVPWTDASAAARQH